MREGKTICHTGIKSVRFGQGINIRSALVGKFHVNALHLTTLYNGLEKIA